MDKKLNYHIGALKRKLGTKKDQPGALIQAAKEKNAKLSKREIAIRGLI